MESKQVYWTYCYKAIVLRKIVNEEIPLSRVLNFTNVGGPFVKFMSPIVHDKPPKTKSCYPTQDS